MPWRITNVISQRSQFILEAKSKEASFSELCRRYNISRTAGYKWIERFEKEGLRGLSDRSRRPKSSKQQTPHEVTTRIVAYRQAHPSWGATTIRKVISKEFKKVPSKRTIHRILQECNFITTRHYNRRRKTTKRIVLKAQYPNHVWTVDFKGWWRTRNGQKVYPLTIRDEYSKMILAIEVLPGQLLELSKQAFIKCFQRYGLPEYIRSDNGSPFSYSQGLCGLSRLSAWWIKLGIIPNFIPPASPQYNPSHERMHRDMAMDLESSPARNIAQQQLVANIWLDEYNSLRPHTALADKTPSQVYCKSKRKYKIATPAIEYLEPFTSRYVNAQGQFKENIGLDFTHPDYVNIWFANTLVARANPDFSGKMLEYDLISGSISCNKLSA
jgi:putative transposase